jgi:hypothetical protein
MLRLSSSETDPQRTSFGRELALTISSRASSDDQHSNQPFFLSGTCRVGLPHWLVIA